MKPVHTTAMKKLPSDFFYKKPCISFEVSQNYSSCNASGRYTRRPQGLSKTKNASKLDIVESSPKSHNNSQLSPSEYKPAFGKKSSLRVITHRRTMLPKSRLNYSSPQVNRLSPKSLMNNKSKEILYKTFLKEFKLAVEGYNKTFSKEGLYLILKTMGYFSRKSNSMTNREGRYVEYIHKITRGLKYNLKLVFLCIESFYQFHLRNRDKSKEKSRGRNKCFPFKMHQRSPDRTENNSSYSYLNSSKGNSMCQSPRVCKIKYDSNNRISNIPEEYEEFLRKKFAKLCMNRTSYKKHDSKSGFANNIQSAKNLNFEKDSNGGDKENLPVKVTKEKKKPSFKQNVLKRLTRVLVEREMQVKAKRTSPRPASNGVKKSTPQVMTVKNSKNFGLKSKGTSQKQLFEKRRSSKSKQKKPLINHELSQKLKTHSLYSGEPKMKTIAINLGDDDSSKDHSDFLNDSIEKVERKESCNVAKSITSEETAYVSVANPAKALAENKRYMNEESQPLSEVQHTCSNEKSPISDYEKLIKEVLEEQEGEDYVSLKDITDKFATMHQQNIEDNKRMLENKNNDINLFKKYQGQKKEIISKAKEAKLDKILEEIQEAENSEYESSTVDERMQTSNIANASTADSPIRKSIVFEEASKKVCKEEDPKNMPLLYIDVKISHEETSRLVLFRNQTPYEAAYSFILKHQIPPKLHPYLISKVEAHYKKYIERSSHDHH